MKLQGGSLCDCLKAKAKREEVQCLNKAAELLFFCF